MTVLYVNLVEMVWKGNKNRRDHTFLQTYNLPSSVKIIYLEMIATEDCGIVGFKVFRRTAMAQAFLNPGSLGNL